MGNSCCGKCCGEDDESLGQEEREVGKSVLYDHAYMLMSQVSMMMLEEEEGISNAQVLQVVRVLKCINKVFVQRRRRQMIESSLLPLPPAAATPKGRMLLVSNRRRESETTAAPEMDEFHHYMKETQHASKGLEELQAQGEHMKRTLRNMR